jgi:hypothetical protein
VSGLFRFFIVSYIVFYLGLGLAPGKKLILNLGLGSLYKKAKRLQSRSKGII